jgi:hypothetical protein
MFGLWVNSLPLPDENIVTVRQYNPLETTIPNQTVLTISGGDGLPRLFSAKSEKFDLAFHRRLEQHFPDWEERMNYQKKQEEFYKSAMRKKSELKRLRIKDNSKRYTKQELDAMDYFHGTGFYKKYQEPAMKPNIFDTRQSFLMKMHDDKLRDNFLDSFNRINN